MDEVMSNIPWSEAFKTGIHIIDEQHRKLFTLMNALIDNIKRTDDTEFIAEAIHEMVQYSLHHFSTEEEFLKEKNFPDFKSHRAQHQAFKKKAVNLCLKAMKHDKEVQKELSRYVIHWVKEHVLYEDMKYIKGD